MGSRYSNRRSSYASSRSVLGTKQSALRAQSAGAFERWLRKAESALESGERGKQEFGDYTPKEVLALCTEPQSEEQELRALLGGRGRGMGGY